jgi:hypothetical protein
MIAGTHLQHHLSGDRISDLGCRVYTVLDESAAFLPELRQRIPDALIALRLLQHSHWGDPERTAREGAELVRQYPQADILIPSNEDNLEHGAGMALIADWSQRFLGEWQRQGAPCRAGTPAISPGVPYDLGPLQGAWAPYPVIICHAYWAVPDDPSPALGMVRAHHAHWPDHPIFVSELNCGQPGELENQPALWGRLVEGTGRFMDELARLGYVEGATWFVEDSRDQLFRLVRMPPMMDLYRRIGHEEGSGPAPGPTPPPSGEIARIEAIYGIEHTDGANFYLARLEERTDPANISATGPPEEMVRIRTNDDAWQAAGLGTVDMPFTHPAQYQPVSQGEKGWYYATCGDATVRGLGWAYDRPPVMQGPHVNVVAHFARRTGAPPRPTEPVQGWEGAFADYARAHPEVGRALGVAVYAPSDWRCCLQVSESHCLVWNGWVVTALSRS